MLTWDGRDALVRVFATLREILFPDLPPSRKDAKEETQSDRSGPIGFHRGSLKFKIRQAYASERKIQPRPGRSSRGPEAVLEIFVIENVLDGSVNSEVEAISLDRKGVARGQVAASVPAKPVHVRRERGRAEYRSEIAARR